MEDKQYGKDIQDVKRMDFLESRFRGIRLFIDWLMNLDLQKKYGDGE